MTLSFNEKSNLFKFTKSIGVDAASLCNESGDVDLTKLVGKYCNIVVEHVESDGKTYANVVAHTKPTKGHEKWDTDYVAKEDRAVAPTKADINKEVTEAFTELFKGEKTK
jgi:hypothetical protein